MHTPSCSVRSVEDQQLPNVSNAWQWWALRYQPQLADQPLSSNSGWDYESNSQHGQGIPPQICKFNILGATSCLMNPGLDLRIFWSIKMQSYQFFLYMELSKLSDTMRARPAQAYQFLSLSSQIILKLSLNNSNYWTLSYLTLRINVRILMQGKTW